MKRIFLKQALRRIAKNCHVWAGLSLGLPFCLMGLSGSVIVYRDAIEEALRPKWMAASHAHPASVLAEVDANLRRRWPNAVRERVTFPREPGEPYRYQIRADDQPLHVYADASTGEILGTFELPWLDWIAGFHQNLRLPPAGLQLVGAIGIALFFSSLLGLSIWLMRNPAWKTIFRIGWRAPWNRLSFDLHRSIGLVATAFLVIISFTGICLGFPNSFRAFAAAITATPSARPARITLVPSPMNQPLASYVQAALAAIPGGSIRELRFPQSPDRPAVIRIWHEGDYRAEGSNQVSLDPASARVVSVDATANWSKARQVSSIPAPIHYAEWGGPLVKVLWCLTGLAPTVLFASGFSFWLAGYRARRKTTTVKCAETPVLAR